MCVTIRNLSWNQNARFADNERTKSAKSWPTRTFWQFGKGKNLVPARLCFQMWNTSESCLDGPSSINVSGRMIIFILSDPIILFQDNQVLPIYINCRCLCASLGLSFLNASSLASRHYEWQFWIACIPGSDQKLAWV